MHGAELRAVREEVGTRPMPEVVRFYGHWKKYAPLLSSHVLTSLSHTMSTARSWERRTSGSERPEKMGSTRRLAQQRGRRHRTRKKVLSLWSLRAT